MLRKFLIALAFMVALLLAGCAMPASVPAESGEPEPTPKPAPTLMPTSTPLPKPTPRQVPGELEVVEEGPVPTPEPTPEPTPRILPVKVAFPSFNTETPIVPVGMDKKNNMATVAKPDVATWYRYGATPGEQGNAIIAGHVRWAGKRGDFALLHDIPTDDEVIVTMDNGEERVFKVISNDTFKLNDVPDWVMALEGEERMTLITCAGEFDRGLGTSNSRTIVVCKLVVSS